jgi:hypothetical protein
MIRDYTGHIDQIKSELGAIGQFRGGRKPMRGGVVVFTDSRLPEGWVGVRDPEGRQAFGSAPPMLLAIQEYVETLRSCGRASFFQCMIFWSCLEGFSGRLLQTWDEEQAEADGDFPLPGQTNFRDPL